jgi:8-oxo-dGTP diphosphatase
MYNSLYIVNVEAAIYKDENWLVIKRSEKEEHAPGVLSMVGGKVETKANENNVLEEALIREIKEEVGIRVSKNLQYIESKAFISDKGQVVIDIVFLCKYEAGEAKIVAADEVSEVYWMSGKEILQNKNSQIWLKESIVKAENLRAKIENSVHSELETFN